MTANRNPPWHDQEIQNAIFNMARCQARAIEALQRDNPAEAARHLYHSLMHAAQAWLDAHGIPHCLSGKGYEGFTLQIIESKLPWSASWSALVSMMVMIEASAEDMPREQQIAHCQPRLPAIIELCGKLASECAVVPKGRSGKL